MDKIDFDSVSVSVTSGDNDSFKLPDTGQTKSYTNTFGEDSDYTINPPSYTDNGDGTVTDSNTGLIWQQEEEVTRNWEDSITYCESISHAGHEDWRLPNIKELNSIVDYNLNSPAIDETSFPNTNSSWHWSSTSVVGKTNMAWSNHFGFGGRIIDWDDKSALHYVRCVRGEEE